MTRRLFAAWFVLTALLMTLAWELARSLCPSVPLHVDSPHIVFNGHPVQGCYRVDLPRRNDQK